MIDFLELQQKIEKQPCLASLINDEYSTLKVSRYDFKLEYSNDTIVYAYAENRDFHLNDLTHSESGKWLIKYIFTISDLQNAEITINDATTINIIFKEKIDLDIMNKMSDYKHNTIYINEIQLLFSNNEDTLDVFNLFKKLKT